MNMKIDAYPCAVLRACIAAVLGAIALCACQPPEEVTRQARAKERGPNTCQATGRQGNSCEVKCRPREKAVCGRDGEGDPACSCQGGDTKGEQPNAARLISPE